MVGWAGGAYDPADFDPARVRFDDPRCGCERRWGERGRPGLVRIVRRLLDRAASICAWRSARRCPCTWWRRCPSYRPAALTSGRYDVMVSAMNAAAKRATVYFDPEIHRALRLKSAATERTISDVVNDAVRLSLAEDAEDLAAFEARKNEPNLDFEKVVRALRRRGKI